MKQFIAFVKKEFYHVFRDKRTLFILFGMPVMQILIFGFALTNEVKNARILVVDHSHDISTQKIIAKIAASQYFQLDKVIDDDKGIQTAFKQGNIRIALVFPEGFQSGLMHLHKAKLQIIADASDPNLATTLTNYLSAIVMDYQAELQKSLSVPLHIIPDLRMFYNPQLKGAPNFVPGVMALVLMLICVLMTAISIVKEKETGTMEILLVSPFKPALVIVAKAVPYLFLSLINLATILLLSVHVLGVPINGSLVLLIAESTLFIVCCLTLGILISIKTNSQQAAMLVSLMGMLLPTVIFSGFMFPIENMPVLLQMISNLVPAKWFYIIIKSIMIKGVGFSMIWRQTLILVIITLVLFLISLKSFKIRMQ